MPEAPRGFVANVAVAVGRRAIGWLLLAVVASLGLVLVETGISLFLQLFLKTLGILAMNVETTSPFGKIPLTPVRLALGLCLLALVRSIALFFVGQSGNISMEMINARLRRIAVWETLLHPAKLAIPAASVNARVGDLANKASQFCYSGSIFLSAIVQTSALALVMLFVARGEALIAILGLGVLGMFVLRVNRGVRRVSANVPIQLRVLTEGIQRIARNIVLIRILRTERVEHRKLTTSIDAYAGHLVHAALLANFAGAATPFAGILLIIVIVATSLGVMHTPGITLLSFLYLFVRFVQTLTTAVQALSTCNTTWPSFRESVDYVQRFQRSEIEDAMHTADRGSGSVAPRALATAAPAPSIEVRAVSFAYPGTEARVLREVSASVAAGEQLAIVGPSGCGKSTLLGLILGLYEPAAGDVRIDGRSPTDYFDDPEVRVGYVGAEAFLIAGTLRDNLRYGLSAEATDADLWRALEEAELRVAVERLPAQLDYPIAEDGSGLSAGQKQRLCLARALLGRPGLLVLDEVSANLDADTEQAIAESLRKLRGSCTIIIVSHREGIFRYADRVISLETMAA